MGLFDFMSEGNGQSRKNELDVYKPGGIQRRELPDFAACSDSTAIINGYIAMWLASMLVNILEDSNGYLMELGAGLDCVTLKNNSREACFQLHLKGTADMQIPLDMNYTYNEMAYKYIRAEIEDGYDIVLTDEKILQVKEMTLSRFIDVRPQSVMRGGRIYK